jgi:hypothetical protein
MNLQGTVLVAALASVVSVSLGGTETNVRPEVADETAENEWECSLSTSTYLAQDARDYANPNFTADRDWPNLEARYNYEALKTGSLWLGYNFSVGKKLTLDATPMIGGVFGDITGIAPGYTTSISCEPFELFTQGEYFFDAAIHAGNFFYSWSELSCAPASWFRVGVVVDRTKALGSKFDICRGPLVGFKYKKVDFTTYWLSPGSEGCDVRFYRSPEFLIDVTDNDIPSDSVSLQPVVHNVSHGNDGPDSVRGHRQKSWREIAYGECRAKVQYAGTTFRDTLESSEDG